MILTIVADTHNNRSALRAALGIAALRGSAEAIHCGDVSTVALLDEFVGWTLHLVFGNTDRDQAGMRARVARLGNRSECGEVIRMEADGLRLRVIHGDRGVGNLTPEEAAQADILCVGHTHRQEDAMIGGMRVLNPGALGGSSPAPRSFCLLDTVTRHAEFIPLADEHLSPE